MKEYLNGIKPYLRDTIINLQKSDILIIELTTAINIMSSKDVKKKHIAHSKSNNEEFLHYGAANEVVDEISTHFLKISIWFWKRNGRKWLYFWFSPNAILQFHKINFKRGGSYIDSLEWIKSKKGNNRSKKLVMTHVFTM